MAITWIFGLIALVYAFFFFFRYDLLTAWLNKWAKVDFVPQSRCNRLLLHGLGILALDALITWGLIALFACIFMDEATQELPSGVKTTYTVLAFLLDAGGIVLYAWLYMKYRTKSGVVTKRQAIWEIVYAVCAVAAIFFSVVVTIYLLIFALAIWVALVILNLAWGENVKVKTPGLFSTTKDLHENLDGTYSDMMGHKYMRDGNDFYKVD